MSSPGTSPEEVSEADLATCVRVLDQVRANPGIMTNHDAKFKKLRSSARLFVLMCEKSTFGGKSLEEYVIQRVRKKIEGFKKARESSLKQMDKNYINTRTLRAQRIEALNNLTHEDPNQILLKGPSASISAIKYSPEAEEPQSKKQKTENPVGRDTAPSTSVESRADINSNISTVAEDATMDEKSSSVTSAPASDTAAATSPAAVKTEEQKPYSTLVPESSQKNCNQNKNNGTKSENNSDGSSRKNKNKKVAFDSALADPELRKEGEEELERCMRVATKIMDEELDKEMQESKGRLHAPRSCYTCKCRFHELHDFYDQLCPECADLNWKKRNQTADLKGRVALLTGGRVKIGFECGLKLLRCGCELIVSTRFPHDCARRYAEQRDFQDWKDRLHIFGLDLRDLASVTSFCAVISKTFSRLDFLVSNAAQTIRRPPAYYKHLMKTELMETQELPAAIQHLVKGDAHSLHLLHQDAYKKNDAKISFISPDLPSTDGQKGNKGDDEACVVPRQSSVVSSALPGGVVISGDSATANKSAALSQMVVAAGDDKEDKHLFPEGRFDVTGQQLDLRTSNSWTMTLEQVDPSEAVECMAINSMSPFILNSKLKPLMMRDPTVDKYIINVSAMEGKFYRHKGPQHPHTNMAKAALNMMTRTSAQDYAKDRIYMNSVDTGWINDENPHDSAQRIAQSNNFQTPIGNFNLLPRARTYACCLLLGNPAARSKHHSCLQK